jgi:hypothetical protein
MMKMTYRAPMFLLALATVAVTGLTGCLQKLDSEASSGITNAVEPDAGLATGVVTNVTTPDIGQTADPSGEAKDIAATACDKVKSDALNIRTNICSGCHYAGGSNPLRDITDDSALINVAASAGAAKFPGEKYVVPGSPDTSLLYYRVAIKQDMPPPSDPGSPLPRPTISDMSDLRAWILCLGTPPAGGTGGATGAGGAAGTGGGTGGTTGTGGRTGTGGATGAGGATGGASGGTTGTGGRAGTGGTTGAAGAPGAGGTTGGADGGVVVVAACAGMPNCNNPMTVTLPYNNANIGVGALCLEIDQPITTVNCTNAGQQRQVRVNGTAVGVTNGTCNATVPIPAARNGGYCVQVNGQGQQGGGQATTLSIQ